MSSQRRVKSELNENSQNQECQDPRQTPQENSQNPNLGQGQNQNSHGANPTSNSQRSHDRSSGRAPRDRSRVPRDRSQARRDRGQPRNMPNPQINPTGSQFTDFLQSITRGIVVGSFEISGDFLMCNDDSSTDEEEVFI